MFPYLPSADNPARLNTAPALGAVTPPKPAQKLCTLYVAILMIFKSFGRFVITSICPLFLSGCRDKDSTPPFASLAALVAEEIAWFGLGSL